jgi:hypothetical protein
MENGNSRTVYVVYADDRKDLKDAERFGRLRDVFSSVGKVYNTSRMIEHARRVLSDWEDGDHLLMIGDPALCAVCMATVLENNSVVNVLRWDRNDFQYNSQRWDFTPANLS